MGHDAHDHHTAPGDHGWGDLVERLELDGEVLAPFRDEAIARLQALSDGAAVRRIVDIGCGPGVATTALAQAFPNANVHAIDGSPVLVASVLERAAERHLADRVSTSVTDLAAGFTIDDPVDVVWASMVLHHLPDPAATLAAAHDALRPDGLLAVIEFGPPTTVLPDELGFGPPGFAERHRDAMRAAVSDHLPDGAFDIDWAAAIGAAGFDVVETSIMRIDRLPPLDPDSRRWVLDGLHHFASVIEPRLDDEDRMVLAALTDPHDTRAAAHRTDLELHQARTMVIARRI